MSEFPVQQPYNQDPQQPFGYEYTRPQQIPEPGDLAQTFQITDEAANLVPLQNEPGLPTLHELEAKEHRSVSEIEFGIMRGLYPMAAVYNQGKNVAVSGWQMFHHDPTTRPVDEATMYDPDTIVQGGNKMGFKLIEKDGTPVEKASIDSGMTSQVDRFIADKIAPLQPNKAKTIGEVCTLIHDESLLIEDDEGKRSPASTIMYHTRQIGKGMYSNEFRDDSNRGAFVQTMVVMPREDATALFEHLRVTEEYGQAARNVGNIAMQSAGATAENGVALPGYGGFAWRENHMLFAVADKVVGQGNQLSFRTNSITEDRFDINWSISGQTDIAPMD